MSYHIDQSILHFGSSSCLVCIMERITLMGDSFACGLPCPLCFSVQAHSCDCLICWRLGLHTPLALSWFLACCPVGEPSVSLQVSIFRLIGTCCLPFLSSATCTHISFPASCGNKYIQILCVYVYKWHSTEREDNKSRSEDRHLQAD